ncbi:MULTISPECIES: helix-turn-helix domain-containing protein [Actinomadura]|uniref:Helix-turn-helix domain-containing protein n=2 Tax=Actinomadura yumaensis TaxID=111807 RepID=A0ABW2CMM0_9ACTN|nr:helix-turn-helix transcriptional regulator [Actinomadura sp. J1-007]
MNERLRRAMLRRGLDIAALAVQAEVSTKSVERWLSEKGVPYPRTRYRVAAILHEDESYLWPSAVDKASLTGAELVSTWPRRTDVPRNLWTELLRGAQRNIDYIAYAGLFLAEEVPDWIPTLRARARAGARVRMLFGDPNGRQLAARDEEKQIGGGVAGRVSAVLSYYRPLADLVDIRLHDTPLYASIYRFDDDLLANIHVYGILAAHTPTMHIRRVDGAYFNTFLESYEKVWASARPLERGEP